ncbi:MAG: pseudaminic acid synthase [Candidatus Omnitrophota bacterium]
MRINNKKVGSRKTAFIIAEISANHGQNFNRAVTLIKKAKESGADAVKFQAYTPDTMTINVNNEYFRIKHPKWGRKTLYQLYKTAYIPWEWFGKLKRVADGLGILFFATAFDKKAVDYLEKLKVSIHKISSFELVDLPLIEYAAKTKKPLILSTGMASVSEIDEAVTTARKAGAKEVILLKCVSDYPAKPGEMNLRTIAHIKELFNCPVGLSDHTLGIGVSIAAVSLGAEIIEKHFTLSRKIKSPDSFFSIEPQELKALIRNVRIVEKALGEVHYGLTKEERKSQIFRRSLIVVKNIRKWDLFTEENVRSIRPGYGLSPKYLKDILGRKAACGIKKGIPLRWDLIS